MTENLENSDENLKAMGLRKTVAYVKDTNQKKRSNNAERQARHREKKKAESAVLEEKTEQLLSIPEDIREYARHDWSNVREAILIREKVKKLSKLKRFILGF